MSHGPATGRLRLLSYTATQAGAMENGEDEDAVFRGQPSILVPLPHYLMGGITVRLDPRGLTRRVEDRPGSMLHAYRSFTCG